jgi:hypothetical protein
MVRSSGECLLLLIYLCSTQHLMYVSTCLPKVTYLSIYAKHRVSVILSMMRCVSDVGAMIEYKSTYVSPVSVAAVDFNDHDWPVFTKLAKNMSS